MAEKGAITVREAGRRGGVSTKKKYGPEFYHSIGKKGGQRVKQLIAQAKRAQKG